MTTRTCSYALPSSIDENVTRTQWWGSSSTMKSRATACPSDRNSIGRSIPKASFYFNKCNTMRRACPVNCKSSQKIHNSYADQPGYYARSTCAHESHRPRTKGLVQACTISRCTNRGASVQKISELGASPCCDATTSPAASSRRATAGARSAAAPALSFTRHRAARKFAGQAHQAGVVALMPPAQAEVA